jgi:DNA processing protein
VVFAVPGPITSPASAGTFRLIKDGAVPVRSPADVFEHISAVTFAPAAAPTVLARAEPPPSFAEDELAVWDALSDTPVRVDTIAETCGLEIPHILGVLLRLELKGFVAQMGGQQFKRVL